MTAIEAVKALLGGKKIRFHRWYDDECCYFDRHSDQIVYEKESDEKARVSAWYNWLETMVNGDQGGWELYEPDKPEIPETIAALSKPSAYTIYDLRDAIVGLHDRLLSIEKRLYEKNV